MTEKSSAGITQPVQNISIKRVWKEMRKDRRILLIDLALFATTFLLIFTDQKFLFLHLFYVLLIYGAFYWSLLAFVFHASFWVTVITITMLIFTFYGSTPKEELFELLILTFVLFMVFGIARKRTSAQKALRASERRYRRLVELAFESVIIIAEEKFVFVNLQAVKLFHANNREELIGESIGKFLHPISFEGFKILAKRAIEGGGEMPFIEEQFTRMDNTYVDIEAVGLVITYQDKPAVQFVIRDITERKSAEEALRVSDSKFRGLFESAPEAIVVVDKTGAITLVNAQTEKMFGYTRIELVDKSVETLLPNILHKFDILQQAVRYFQRSEHEEDVDTSLTGVRRNGREFPISVKLSPLMTDEGISITIIIRDLSEQQKAQEEVVRAARLAVLGQMAAALAHELNNPLQIIQGYLDIVLDFAIEPDEREKYLHIVRQQIERLHSATDNILNYAKPKKKPQQPVALVDLINQVLALTAKQLEQSQIRVVLNLQEVPPVLIATDPLTQVFLNLVINAVESTVNEDDRLLQIDLGANEDNQVFVSFTSNGPAIPEEDLPHIFEPFYTTKSEGSGLGLWVSRNLVEQYDGKLRVKNLMDGKGVVFTVSFPPIP
ncbi:MAG: PAS domain S-box protein [Anaerolineae bacterium]